MADNKKYILTVTTASGDETIKIDTSENESAEITKVLFKMNTIDEDAKSYTNAIRPEFKIWGTIDDETKEKTLPFVKWALDRDEETLNRDVELLVFTSTGQNPTLLRRYKFAHMYVVDYEEEDGNYMLYIVQNRTKYYARNVDAT